MYGGPDPRNPVPANGQQTSVTRSSNPPQMQGQPPLDPNSMPMPMHQGPPQGSFRPGTAPSYPPGYTVPNQGPPPHQFTGHPPSNSTNIDPRQQMNTNGASPPPSNQAQQQQMMHGRMPTNPMEYHQMYHQMAMHHPMMMRNGEMPPMPPLHGQQQQAQSQQGSREHAKMGDGPSATTQAEMGAQASMPHMHFPQMPPGALNPFVGAPSSVPLRESLVHNVRGHPMTMEEMQAEQAALASAGGVRPRQKSPNKAASLQDAASALLTMGTTIQKSEDGSADEAQDSIDSDKNKESESVDPNKKHFPTRLACPEDEDKLNSMHCFLRSELLEVFLVEDLPEPPPKPADYNENSLEALEAELNHAPPPNSAKNRIGIRCVHCHNNKRLYGKECEAPMAVFYPKSLSELYRLVTSWQRVHLRKCKNLPKNVEHHYRALRATDKTRGKTHYWVTSAKKLGFRDSKRPSGGIVYEP